MISEQYMKTLIDSTTWETQLTEHELELVKRGMRLAYSHGYEDGESDGFHEGMEKAVCDKCGN